MAGHRVEHLQALADDLLADAVARQDRDRVRRPEAFAFAAAFGAPWPCRERPAPPSAFAIGASERSAAPTRGRGG